MEQQNISESWIEKFEDANRILLDEVNSVKIQEHGKDPLEALTSLFALDLQMEEMKKHVRELAEIKKLKLIKHISENVDFLFGKSYYSSEFFNAEFSFVGALDANRMHVVSDFSGVGLKSFDEIEIVSHEEMVNDLFDQFDEVTAMMKQHDKWIFFKENFVSPENKNFAFLVLTEGNQDYKNGMGRLQHNMESRIIVRLS